MKSRFVALTLAAVLASGAYAFAHHSFAGTYREDQLLTLEGTVVEFNIRNPHSFILFEVKDKEGKVTRWGGEWGGVTQLSQGGVTRYTLKVGDKIVIEGAPPRDTLDHKILVRQVTRPADGWKWQGRVQ